MIAFRGRNTLTQASGTTVSVEIPTATKPGDTLLFALLVEGGTGITITPPTDWELVLRTDSTTVISLAVYRHRYLATSTDPVVFTITSCEVAAILSAWGGADQVTAVNISGGQANASSANCVAPSVTTTMTDAHLVGHWGGATGVRTATPPSGWTERADVQQTDLGFSLSDIRQETLGASGTKTTTLSGAAVNIGMIVALAPSALNTPTAVRDDGNWSVAGWENRFTTEAAMSAYVERQIHRANAELRLDLPEHFYANHLLTDDPWMTLLYNAEMHRTQALLLYAAATVAESSDDNSPAPFFGDANALRSAAAARIEMYQEIVARAARERDSALASAPPTTRAGFRGALRRALRDEQGARFSDAQLHDALWAGLQEYNLRFPREVAVTLSLTEGTRRYALTGVSGVREVFRVEYPTGNSVPTYLEQRGVEDPDGFYGESCFATTGGPSPTELVLGPEPGAGESARIEAWCDHTFPESDAAVWTVPARDVGHLVRFGRWYLLDAVGDERARDARAAYETGLAMRAGHGYVV